MQITSYNWFSGREKNQPCLVAGTAPTIENFNYSKFNGVYITCGDGAIRLKSLFTSDYWVNANNEFPVPEKHLNIINSLPETVFIFSDSVTYSRKSMDLKFLKNKLKVKWFAYDQRHFERKKCLDKKLKCCELLDIYPDRITLQEFLQKKYNLPNHYSSGATVSIHALAFAILMECSPIYLQGIEIPLYSSDYGYKDNSEVDSISRDGFFSMFVKKIRNGSVRSRMFEKIKQKFLKRFFQNNFNNAKSPFFEDVPRILADFEYLINLANQKGIEVCNLSKTSTLNRIKTLKTRDYRNI